MDVREILTSLLAAAAVTALLAHGFKSVRAEMPAIDPGDARAPVMTCPHDAGTRLPCPSHASRR